MKVQINKPIVIRQIRGLKLTRSGRGFSKSELKEAGIINIRMIAENVEQLKPIVKDILNLRKIAEKKG